MTTNKGLGKGMDALVPMGTSIDIVTTQPQDRIHHLSIEFVQPKANQPRQNFNEQLMEQLAQSVREQGILQPIIVVQDEQNKYSIIAGERRWRAAQMVGLKKVPAIIRAVDELEHLELALLENVQRADLNPIETAHTIHRLHHEFQQSYEDIAKRLGKAYTTVVNAMRLLQLPQHMQQAVLDGRVTEGHARALLALSKNTVKQEALFQKICQQHLSVRQAEQYAKAHKVAGQKPVLEKTSQPIINKDLSSKYNSKVSIKKSVKGGIVTFLAKTDKELEALLDKLNNN